MYAKVIIPLKLSFGAPSYSYPESWGLKRGDRVTVACGAKEYQGVVEKVSEEAPEGIEGIAPIISTEKDRPGVSDEELRLWEFVASYYLCTIGEVAKAALPAYKLYAEKMTLSTRSKLETKISKLSDDITGKHGEAVRARLLEKKSKAEAELETLNVPDIEVSEAPYSGFKPTVYKGTDRLAYYIGSIREELSAGRQVLVLEPDIAYCSNTASRLLGEFGPKLRSDHSHCTESQRAEVLTSLRKGESLVVVGTKSAVFLPFRRLSLVIIDEEQEPLYRYCDSAPRFSGRDAAVYLSQLHGARVILGSASPSLESVLNCHIGKYSLVESGQNIQLPEIIDTSEEARKNGMLGPLSRRLIKQIKLCKGCTYLVCAQWSIEEVQKRLLKLELSEKVVVGTLRTLQHLFEPNFELIALLRAEDHFNRDDFRRDERAMQLLCALSPLAPKLIIQTPVPSRFAGVPDPEALLIERQQFGFPPFKKIVDVRERISGKLVQRYFLKRDRDLPERKIAILSSTPKNCYPDVDPQ